MKILSYAASTFLLLLCVGQKSFSHVTLLGGASSNNNPSLTGTDHVATLKVNKLVHRNDQNQAIVIKGVIPIPPLWVRLIDDEGALTRSYKVKLPNGSLVPAQLNVVSVHPSNASRLYVSKLQIIARVINYSPNSDLEFEVHEVNEPYYPAQSPNLHPTVENLLSHANNLFVSTTDLYGVGYGTSAIKEKTISGKPNHETLNKGWYQREKSYHNIMQLLPSQQSEKEHLFGVKTFVRERFDKVLEVDFLIHNAHSGDKAAVNNPIYNQYFKDIRVYLPLGYGMRPIYETIASKANLPVTQGNHPITGQEVNVFRLIKKLPDNKLQVVRMGRHFMVRTLIYPDNVDPELVGSVAEREFLAFTKPGMNAAGTPLYDFSNPRTNTYMPNTKFPRLDNVYDMAEVRQDYKEKFEYLKDVMKNGSSSSSLRIFDEACGYFHPGGDGVQGGLASGDGILKYVGLVEIAAQSKEAMMFHEGYSQLVNNRQYFTLYNADGTATKVEDWLYEDHGYTINPAGNGQEGICMKDSVNSSTDDPFGYCDVVREQEELADNPRELSDTQYAQANDLIPTCQAESKVLTYNDIDDNHVPRLISSIMPAAAILNDAISIENLNFYTEKYRLKNSDYPWGLTWGNWQPKYLFMAEFARDVAENPGAGIRSGVRGFGHSLNVVSTAYTLKKKSSDRGKIKNLLSWIIDDILAKAQPTCSMNFGSYGTAGPIQRKYLDLEVVPDAQQGWESNLYLNGIYAALEGVFKFDGNNGTKGNLREVMRKISTYYVMGNIPRHANGNFYKQTTTHFNGEFLCDQSQQYLIDQILAVGPWNSAGSALGPFNNTHTGTYFYLGYEMTGDTEFLCEATRTFGNGTVQSLRNNIESDYKDIPDIANLMAAFQSYDYDVPGCQ